MGTGSDRTGASAQDSRALVNLPQERKRNTATQTPRITRTISACVQYFASCRFPSTKQMYLDILIRLSATLFSSTLARQSLLRSPPVAGLQVIRVTLYVPNDVLRLNLALEAAEGILQRLALLQSNFSQAHHPPI